MAIEIVVCCMMRCATSSAWSESDAVGARPVTVVSVSCQCGLS